MNNLSIGKRLLILMLVNATLLLAERTAESTRTIATVIGKVQAGASRAALEMGSGVARVDGGVRLANQAGDSIAGMAEENSASVRQTSAAAGRLHEMAGELERSVARFRV
jgi:methyl-accepting chemotaxis protein